MSAAFDLAIAGLGAMGSATALHAARGGLRTIAFDRFVPPHTRGSSHGESRIIREAYFEDPSYVPIVQRATQLWRELEQDCGERLVLPTGGLMIGRPESAVVAGAIASGETHRLPHEVLDARQVRVRFPALRPDDDMMAVWEPHAGVLFPEACVAAQLRAAAQAGARLCSSEPVTSWRPDGEGVAIETPDGNYRASKLVLAAGAWMPDLLREIDGELSVARQPLFWFEPRANERSFDPERLPIHIWEWSPGRCFYGFPRLNGLVKMAVHGEGEPIDPDALRRDLVPDEAVPLRERLERFLPDAAGRLVLGLVCLYTNTRDRHFLIDRHPRHPQVVVVSACSGHGFKFAPAIGEIAVELALGKTPKFDLGLFGWRT